MFAPKDISYFIAIAESGRFMQAAQVCGVSQSALTKAVQRLEAMAGATLFERGAHGARLTSAGRVFLEQARMLELANAEMMRLVEDIHAQHAGLLRIGATDTTNDSVAARAISVLVRRRPAMRVALVAGLSDVLCQMVLNGELDLAVVPNYPARALQAELIVLQQEAQTIITRARHPIQEVAAPCPRDLIDCRWALPRPGSSMRELVHAALAQHRLGPPNVVLEIDFTSDAALAIVASTDLLAMAPMSLVARAGKRSIAALAIKGFQFTRQIVLVSRAGARWSPLMEALKTELSRGVSEAG